jgi:GNAT superfamily N-acetyltransferase
LRAATPADRPFIESVYFETQRWIIERLFGWRGDAKEREKFHQFYPDEIGIDVIVVDGKDVGWQLIRRSQSEILVEGMYISNAAQNRGTGTALLRSLISEAAAGKLPLRLSTAKINPARALYEKLGFVATGEDRFKVYLEYRTQGRRITNSRHSAQ